MCPSTKNTPVFNDRGTIKRVYLENFVTYDKVEILPGPNLNVIIGPNGTGKSTIVCAIVLGLGGKPNVIGRGETVASYVKADCQSASIEIDLKDTDEKTIKIIRHFNLRNESTWSVNGNRVQPKEIQRITRSLNIHVDNLCQLLPQDKVQDFSKMNQQELLENTVKSVGIPCLMEHQAKLKDLRKRCREIEENLANRTVTLNSEVQKYEGMKQSVSNIKERKIIKKRMVSLRQKKAWIRYDMSRKELCKVKALRDRAAAELKELDEQLQPVNEQLEKLKKHIANLQKKMEKYNSDLFVKTSRIEKTANEVQSKEHEIREVEKNCEERINMEKNRDQEIAAVEQQKSKFENDLKNLIEEVGTEETLIADQKKMTDELERKKLVAQELMNLRNGLKMEETQISDQIKLIENEMKAADVEAERLDLLRSQSPDVYRGVMWLRQNREKFVAPVHEPMLLSIHVKDVHYAKYIESIISYRDLLAFVCEDIGDMNLLMEYLRDQQQLKINVVHSDPNREVKTRPNIPMDSLKQYGFHSYLIDLIEAPPTVMNYLILNYNIHNIPLGSKIVDDNVERIPNGLRIFFSQNNVHATSTSKYSSTKSIRSSTVTGNEMLSIILDREKLRNLAAHLEKLNENRTKITEKLKAIEADVPNSNREIDELRTAKQQSQRKVHIIQNLKSRTRMAEEKIRNLQNERTSIEDIKNSAAIQIQKLVRKQSEFYPRYNKEVSDCFKFMTLNEASKFEIEFRRIEYQSKKAKSQSLREKYEFAEHTYKGFESDLEPMKAETQKYYERALDSTDRFCPSDKEFKPFQTAFAKLPFTLEQINQEIETAQAKVYCLGDNPDAEQILQNYEKAEANVRKLNDDLAKLTAERSRIDSEIEELRPLWINPLESLIERIHNNFSSYFNLMGCAGEVTLKTPDCIHDYDQYGMKIRVKFRERDELQELTRQHQSGGERAVTTAVYMIALQELSSSVPFRCVDEINQGMDAINERRVFDLIVKITGKASSCQYFLLTPKLLPNLKYGENVTVHCVFNGPFMVPCTQFDTASLCQRLASSR